MDECNLYVYTSCLLTPPPWPIYDNNADKICRSIKTRMSYSTYICEHLSNIDISGLDNIFDPLAYILGFFLQKSIFSFLSLY